MSNEGSPSDLNGEQLRRMISAWCDGRISDAEFERLQAALKGSREARATYIAYMGVHAGVHGETAAKEFLQSVAPHLCVSEPSIGPNDRESVPPQRRTTPKHWGSRLAVAIVACLTIVAAVSWLPALTRNPQHDSPADRIAESRPAPIVEPDSVPVVLAHVVHQTPDCEWSLDHKRNSPTSAICRGDMIRVARGIMKFQFENGTVLTLHGPALFEVVSDMRGRALLGKLTAKIAKGAEGYSVLTPRATVVDLGTELGIEVDDAGATDVVVFEGSVDLRYRSQPGGQAQQRRLTMGEAMHFDAYGTISRITSITDQRFSDEPFDPAQDAQRPAIISAVRDNIQRQTTWNYYEIVHSGMREDARAFVDREAHEWNGLDNKGMPKYLVGGDYVKTFNNDKCRKDIEIIVALEAACKLYILVDDRISPPGWLRQQFRDTGDKIGIDGGPWVYNAVASQGVQSAVGAGQSIDDVLSVWVRDVTEAGPVRLGATETPHDDLNMYGIVAVPLKKGQ